jgi:hypothetical protein
MKMGNIKNEYLTLGLQLKNKGSILLFRGRPPFLKLVPQAKDK